MRNDDVRKDDPLRVERHAALVAGVWLPLLCAVSVAALVALVLALTGHL